MLEQRPDPQRGRRGMRGPATGRPAGRALGPRPTAAARRRAGSAVPVARTKPLAAGRGSPAPRNSRLPGPSRLQQLPHRIPDPARASCHEVPLRRLTLALLIEWSPLCHWSGNPRLDPTRGPTSLHNDAGLAQGRRGQNRRSARPGGPGPRRSRRRARAGSRRETRCRWVTKIRNRAVLPGRGAPAACGEAACLGPGGLAAAGGDRALPHDPGAEPGQGGDGRQGQAQQPARTSRAGHGQRRPLPGGRGNVQVLPDGGRRAGPHHAVSRVSLARAQATGGHGPDGQVPPAGQAAQANTRAAASTAAPARLPPPAFGAITSRYCAVNSPPPQPARTTRRRHSAARYPNGPGRTCSAGADRR